MSTNTLAKIIAGAIEDSIEFVPDQRAFGQAFALNVFKRTTALNVDVKKNSIEFLTIMRELAEEAEAEDKGLALSRTEREPRTAAGSID